MSFKNPLYCTCKFKNLTLVFYEISLKKLTTEAIFTFKMLPIG